MRFKVSQQSRQVACLLDHRARRFFYIHSKFVSNNSAECCFSQSGWAVKKNMIQRFVAHLRRLDKYFQVLDDLVLPCKIDVVVGKPGYQKVEDELQKIIDLLEENNGYESWTGEKMKVTTRVDGVKQLYFVDPDGYWIEINNDYPKNTK